MTETLRVPSESYPMNTNITRFTWFSKKIIPCALDEHTLSIERVKETVSVNGWPPVVT